MKKLQPSRYVFASHVLMYASLCFMFQDMDKMLIFLSTVTALLTTVGNGVLLLSFFLYLFDQDIDDYVDKVYDYKNIPLSASIISLIFGICLYPVEQSTLSPAFQSFYNFTFIVNFILFIIFSVMAIFTHNVIAEANE